MNKKINVAIVVLSDRCYKKIYKDLSGKEIKKIIQKNSISSDWKISDYKILPDNKNLIKKHLIHLVDKKKVDFIITSGGTGITKRDITPEATKEIIEKELVGISEMLRFESYKKNKNAILSRGITGTRKQSLIINLPGSVNAVKEELPLVLPFVKHIIDLLNGIAHHKK
ncbi:MAG: MogA/MoaB family molybdenum cofactor biosynthesis protein [Endomicrobiia bacterium]